MNHTENFIKGSNNLIELTLTDDGDPILGVWSQLDIFIGDPALVTITRLQDGAGVTFDSGVLSINPGQLGLTQNELDALVDGRLYPIWVRLTSSFDTEGVDFGGPDSIDRMFFLISERP